MCHGGESEWKPVINPVHNYTLDGRLREGNTYQKHSALEVSYLEPLEQSVHSLWLVAMSSTSYIRGMSIQSGSPDVTGAPVTDVPSATQCS